MTKKSKKRLFKKKVNKPVVKPKNITKRPPRNTFWRKNEKSILLVLIPVTLLAIFFGLFLLSDQVQRGTRNIEKAKSVEVEIVDYPKTVDLITPDISAKSALIMDDVSKKIIYSKNANIRFSMASTVKIMTALIALDYFDTNSVLTVKSSGIEGSTLGLLPGEQYYFEDLLYAMMLPSANDAAVTIVDNYPGGRTAFVHEMNRKADEFRLEDTSFFDPVGLDDDGNFTSAQDLSLLGVYALRNKELAKIVNTREKYIMNLSKTREFDLKNLNRFLGYKGVNGIKTGTTEGAGEVLVTSALIKDHKFIIVVMNSSDRFSDTDKLLNLISENVIFENPDRRK